MAGRPWWEEEYACQASEKYIYMIDLLNLIHQGHFLYPADENGAHLPQFFTIEPIVKYPALIREIGQDVMTWLQGIEVKPDVIFAPAQSGVKEIARTIAYLTRSLSAFWEYLPSGRFGNKLVEGGICSGDKVLVFNGVTHQGRCVGERLPQFVESFGGKVEAVAVVAKNRTSLVREVEKKYGRNFFSPVSMNFPVYRPEECPECRSGSRYTLRPWTDLLKNSA